MKKFHIVYRMADCPVRGVNKDASNIHRAIILFCDEYSGADIIAIYSVDDITEILLHQKTEFNASTIPPQGEEDRDESLRLKKDNFGTITDYL